jgi:Tol biopolymer transport system component
LKKNRHRFFKLVLALLILALSLVTVFILSGVIPERELLLVWGNPVSETAQGCVLRLIDPEIGRVQKVITPGERCNYQIAQIDGKSRLIQLQTKPGQIRIYKVADDLALSIEKTLSFGEIQLTSRPQWGQDGNVYISGILEGKEHIWQANERTGAVVSFLTYEDITATKPLISPDGRFLVYTVWDRVQNSNLCRGNCYTYYHLVEIESLHDLALSSFTSHLPSDIPLTHCDIEWAPEGSTLAFKLGCGPEVGFTPGRVVIVDAEAGRVVDIIEPLLKESYGVGLIGWLTNEKLIYSQPVLAEGYDDFLVYRSFTFSTSGSASEEFFDYPKVDEQGLGIPIGDLNWTNDGNWVVGKSNSSDGTAFIIVEMNNGSPRTSIIPFTDNSITQPKWSPSGQWITYYSYNDGSIHIISKTGSQVIQTDVSEIYQGSPYEWLKSN